MRRIFFEPKVKISTSMSQNWCVANTGLKLFETKLNENVIN